MTYMSGHDLTKIASFAIFFSIPIKIKATLVLSYWNFMHKA